MQYEKVGIFENGQPLFAQAPFDSSASFAAIAQAKNERRVLVRIIPGARDAALAAARVVGATRVVVEVLFTQYDFDAPAVVADIEQWHRERRVDVSAPRLPPETRSHWVETQTSAFDAATVAALIDVILQACQRTRRWTGYDPSVIHITKEGPPS